MTPELNPDLIQYLNRLLGMKGIYDGAQFQLIEVITTDAMLVLAPVATKWMVQNDFLGEARRLAHKTYSVPLFSELCADLHPVASGFLGEKISRDLRQLCAPNLPS